VRVLCLQGGGMRGALQVECAIRLVSQRPYDLILGTSVGALNGAMLAGKAYTALRRLWLGIHDPAPVDGIKGLMRFAGFLNGASYYTLAPVQDLLDRHVRQDAPVALGVGVVDLRRDTHHTLYARDAGSDAAWRAQVRASASVPFVHDCPSWGGTTWGDGGLKHSFPPPPAGATEVDVVLCHPRAPAPRPARAIDHTWERAGVLVDALTSTAQAADIERLRGIRAMGVAVRVFAPREEMGGFLDAHRDTIRALLEESRAMLAHPQEP